MMRLTSSFLLSLLCAIALAGPFDFRRTLANPGAHGQTTRSRSRKQSRRTVRPMPVVQEIDGEALRKILARDQTSPRPLLINFWATWCGPCREEFPDLVRIGDDYKSRNLDFILVSLDDPSELKSGVPRFLRRMRAVMPAYLLNEMEPDSVITAVDPEWAGSMPATFLLDSSGQLVYKHIGVIDPEELRAELEKVVEKK